MCMWSSKTLIMHLFLLYYAWFFANSNLNLSAKWEAESLIRVFGECWMWGQPDTHQISLSSWHRLWYLLQHGKQLLASSSFTVTTAFERIKSLQEVEIKVLTPAASTAITSDWTIPYKLWMEHGKLTTCYPLVTVSTVSLLETVCSLASQIH